MMADPQTLSIPKQDLEVLLAASRLKDKSKDMLRDCLVNGFSFNMVAIGNGVSRQHVQQLCQRVYSKYKNRVNAKKAGIIQ